MEETAEVTLNVDVEGVERVTEGFQRIGDAAGDMGRKVADSGKQTNAASDATLRYDASQKQLMMTTAGLIGNSIQLGDLMDRMAKGQVDVGRGALLLSMNFLQLGSQLYLLRTKYGEKIAAQELSIAGDVKEAASGLGSAIAGKIKVFVDLIARYGAKIAAQTVSIAGDVQEAASAAAGAVAEGVRTAASWARTVAEKAKAIALAIANSLEGPWGWAVLAGATAAAGVGIALASKIPGAAEGGIAYNRTLAWVGEREPEIIAPLSRILNTTSNVVHNEKVFHVYIQNPTFRSREDMDYMVKALRRGVE